MLFRDFVPDNGVRRRAETQGPRRHPENARSASSILHHLWPQRGNGNGRQHFRDPAFAWSAWGSRFLPPGTRLSRSAGDLFEPRGRQTQSAFADAAIQLYRQRQAKRSPVFLFNWGSYEQIGRRRAPPWQLKGRAQLCRSPVGERCRLDGEHALRPRGLTLSWPKRLQRSACNWTSKLSMQYP